MNLHVHSTSIARASHALRLDRRLHLVVDVAVIALVFVAMSFYAWGGIQRWRRPEIGLIIMAVTCILPVLKVHIAKTTADKFQRAARLTTSVTLVYACISVFLLLSRSYYSRPFLIGSFILIVIWQVIDSLLISVDLRRQLVAVPSEKVDLLRQKIEGGIKVLQSPSLLGPGQRVDGVVVDLHERLTGEWNRFIAECAASGIPIYHAAAVHEAVSGKVSLGLLHDGWISDFFKGQSRYLRLKRVIDVVGVLVALPVVLPLSLAIALAIKLDSPGPAIFRQVRVGRRGVPFSMVKFRSMVVDSEVDGAQFTADEDPRITRVGRILRRFRLDELPQLWNVLKGEMSLIGPRPEQVVFAKEYAEEIPFYNWRHHVKPGITGWAQVQQGYAAGLSDTREKIEYDLYYVKHVSFWLDLSIVFRTIKTILTGGGAR